jgi:hypothetical protein
MDESDDDGAWRGWESKERGQRIAVKVMPSLAVFWRAEMRSEEREQETERGKGDGMDWEEGIANEGKQREMKTSDGSGV